MPSTSSDPDGPIPSLLPQCGFGSEHDFDSLIKSNRFLFRVYTPKERSPFADDTDPFFVAPRFDELIARSPIDLPNVKFSEPAIGTYADVTRHMEWTTRTSSTYVSTSFSFTWAIWEAVRRYHIGIKKDVEIAIIDATALDGRGATAIQLLEKSTLEERDEQFWKWHRFSKDSQSVLVYGMVPRTAVLASIPLLQILRKMPSYFLRKDIQIIEGNPLNLAAWDYAKRKHNYRQFCLEMSKSFMGKSVEVRLRDSTAGAVRLALSFLRPFIHNTVQNNFEGATSYLRTLALAISEWPGGWWVKDHPEVRQIIEVMVLAVAEELKDKNTAAKDEEILRLQLVIGGLEKAIEIQQRPTIFAESTEFDSDGELEIELEESDDPTLVNLPGAPPPSPPHRREPLPMSVAIPPKISISFQTPITPPESPGNSIFSPNVAVPFSDIIYTSKSSPEQPSAKEGGVHDHAVYFIELPAAAASDEPASPPPTPLAGSPILSPAKLPTILEADFVPEEDSDHEVDDRDEIREDAGSAKLTGERDYDQSNEERQNQDDLPILEVPSVDQAERHSQSMDDQEQQKGETELEINSHIEQDYFSQLSAVQPWIAIHQLGSPLSSRRSSIVSVETLCDPIEFPSKRLSFATTSDSFEFVPIMRSAAMSSRTVSFSEFSPPIPSLVPLQPEAKTETQPPSPNKLVQSQSSDLSDSITRSSSSSSNSSTVSNDVILPLITPLPPSPAFSFDSLPSSISHSSSSSFSTPATPVVPLSENPSTESFDVFIPPKPPIGLLAPLLDQEEEQHIVRRRRSRPGVVSETASYIVTGFLFGAFITIFLFSTQRKTLLYVT